MSEGEKEESRDGVWGRSAVPAWAAAIDETLAELRAIVEDESWCGECAAPGRLRDLIPQIEYRFAHLTESTGRFIKPNLTPPDGVQIARTVTIETDNESTGDSAAQS